MLVSGFGFRNGVLNACPYIRIYGQNKICQGQFMVGASEFDSRMGMRFRDPYFKRRFVEGIGTLELEHN